MYSPPESDQRPVLSVLGPLTIEGAKRSRRGLRARALDLIAFLTLRRDGAQRDEILEALWPGEDPKRSRHRFYQALRDARGLLGDAVASERDRYWLDRDRVAVDLDEVESLVETAARARNPHDERQALEQALCLFRGEPFVGIETAWAEGEARRLRAVVVESLERVGRLRLEAGEATAALDAAERGIALDLLNESLWRLALEAEAAVGLREAVVERYEVLRQLLGDRLGLEPQRETRALCLRLLGQE